MQAVYYGLRRAGNRDCGSGSARRRLAYAVSVLLDWQTGDLAQGLRCYRSGAFWDAHEHWEIVWRELPEPEKNFLRALIQMAAAFHHVQQNNTRGAASLLGKALGRLERCPQDFGGVDAARLRGEAAAWARALEEAAVERRPAEFPRIRVLMPRKEFDR